MTSAHSKYGASKAAQWMGCPGSLVLGEGLPDTSSVYAQEGTNAHRFAEAILQGVALGDKPAADMHEYVTQYVDNIRQYAQGGSLLVEQRVNYAGTLGVHKDLAWGTSDAIIIQGDEIQVHDLKYGQGEVVNPAHNPQMQLYALGALEQLDALVGPFKHVRMVIHQPRVVSAPQEWDCTVEELREFGRTAQAAAYGVKAAEIGLETKTQAEWEQEYLRPGADQCRWCKAKATCNALRTSVAQTVAAVAPATPEEFADLTPLEPTGVDAATWLSACMAKADIIEGWLKAVRAEVERRLLSGASVPGYKLVQGKQGNRTWRDATLAEAAMKALKLKKDEMYDMKIISPTTAEKLLKSAPAKWEKVQEHITRADGKPSVAPESDKRPAIDVKPVVDEFSDIV